MLRLFYEQDLYKKKLEQREHIHCSLFLNENYFGIGAHNFQILIIQINLIELKKKKNHTKFLVWFPKL